LPPGCHFTLQIHHERREIVAVCRSLLHLGALIRVAGDEEGYVHHAAEGTEHATNLVSIRHLTGRISVANDNGYGFVWQKSQL
jgi:Protein of unknown function (DUF2398)